MLAMLAREEELIIKEFVAMTIGSICVFSFLYFLLSVMELVILYAIRVVFLLSKVAIKVAAKAMLMTLQTTVGLFADLMLRPLVPSLAVSLKFRTFQLCRRIWILVTQRQEVEVTDPTVYVYDPRGRTFQSFDPNWKPALGSFKKKLAKKRHLQKIRQLRGDKDNDDSLSNGIQSLSARTSTTSQNAKVRPATCWTTPPRQHVAKALTPRGRRIAKGRSSPAPGSLAFATDSDTDSNISHPDTSFLQAEHAESELGSSFLVEPLDA